MAKPRIKVWESWEAKSKHCREVSRVKVELPDGFVLEATVYGKDDVQAVIVCPGSVGVAVLTNVEDVNWFNKEGPMHSDPVQE